MVLTSLTFLKLSWDPHTAAAGACAGWRDLELEEWGMAEAVRGLEGHRRI